MADKDTNHNSNLIALTRLQKAIGDRMLWSKRNIPCFYLSRRADITELLDMRRGAARQLNVKVTTNDFLLKAVAMAVAEYPLMAAVLEGDEAVVAPTVNVGFAVAAPHGLVVPVVKDAHEKSLAAIAMESESLMQKARGNRLSGDEMTGACITISNLGVYGIESFIAITSPGQAAVVAVGNIIKSPEMIDGEISVRRMIELTISVDHTLISSFYAAQFLGYAAGLLERPVELLGD